MIGAFDPVQAPGRRHGLQDALHEIAAAERVTRAVEAEHRHADAREMGVAQLFGLAGGVKRVGE